MIHLYRVYFHRRTKVVLGFQWTDQSKTPLPSGASLKVPTRVFESTLAFDGVPWSRIESLQEITWQPYSHISDLTTGNFNEDLWTHLGYEFVGALSLSRLSNPHRVQEFLSQAVKVAEAQRLDPTMVAPTNKATMERFHQMFSLAGSDPTLLSPDPLPDIGPLLIGRVSTPQFNDWLR